MKKTIFLFLLIAVLLPGARLLADSAGTRMSGKIYLQVEDKGKAWYVDPKTNQRAFLGRPADAFKVMRELGLGVAEKSYADFNGKAPKSLSGRIILRVQAKGEAYYVDTGTQELHSLGRPNDAFNVMKSEGVGITNSDLNKVPVFQKYKEQTEANTQAIESINKKISEQQSKIIELDKKVNPTLPTCTYDSWNCGTWGSCQSNNIQKRSCTLVKNCVDLNSLTPVTEQSCNQSSLPSICTFWSYSDWSQCSSSGLQTRSILSSYPDNCSNGNPVLAQSCSYVAPTCTSWSYSDWSTCSIDGQQTRTISSVHPNGCIGGNPVSSQACVYAPTCSCSDVGKECCSSCAIGDTCGGGILININPNVVSAPADCSNTNTCPIQESTIKNWSLAMTTCQNLSVNGYNDWYLPNLDELGLLYVYKTSHASSSEDYSFMVSSNYWSSTSYDNDISKAWLENFVLKEYSDYGGVQALASKNTTWYVRCVRKLN